MKSKRILTAGVVVFVVVVVIFSYIKIPFRGRLIGSWGTEGPFLTGSRAMRLWDDGTFRASRSGVHVYEGVWRLRGFTLETEVVRESNVLAQTSSRVYEFLSFTVAMSGPNHINLSGGHMVRRSDDESESKPQREDDWPSAPRLPLPFFVAVQKGDTRLVATMLQQDRAWATNRNYDGSSGIMLAVYSGNSEMAKLLLKNGADPDSANRPGLPALSVAILGEGDDETINEIVELLLASRAGVNRAGVDGTTPLHAAAHRGRLAVSKRLLAAGANPNAVLRDGRTPLHVAVSNRDIRLSALLLESGSDVNLQDKWGASASRLALDQENQELKALFMKTTSVP